LSCIFPNYVTAKARLGRDWKSKPAIVLKIYKFAAVVLKMELLSLLSLLLLLKYGVAVVSKHGNVVVSNYVLV